MGIKGSINDTNSNKNKIDRSTISSKQIKELMKTHHIYMNWKKAHENPDWFKLPNIDSRKWGFELVADADIPENELGSAKETSDRILENIYAYLEKKSKSLSDNDIAAFYPIKKYFDGLKENKPAVIKTQKEFNINKQKYVNKPKELPEGQNVIITPYEEKKNSEVKPQETNKVLMYVPEYVKEADGKVTVETKAVEVPKEVIITPPPVAIEKPKEIQEVTDQVENQQQTQTVTTAQQSVQYAKSKITINSVINNPIFSVFTYLDTNYRKKHPLPPSPFGSLVAADPDYTKPQETARSMFVDWDFCDSNYGNNVTKIDYIEYSTFKLFTNAEFLKFIGQYNQQPLFKVYFDQNDERHLILIAEDENGIIQIDHNRFLNQNNTNVKYNSRSK